MDGEKLIEKETKTKIDIESKDKHNRKKEEIFHYSAEESKIKSEESLNCESKMKDGE